LIKDIAIYIIFDVPLATATIGFENGAVNLNGKCNLIHSDVNVDWQHVLAQHLR